MGFLRKRANGSYAYAFRWKGKQHIKTLGTDDEQEAEQIKKDADEQLDRIRKGHSALASRLLADGHLIMDVLFGSDEIAHLIPDKPDDNPLTVPRWEGVKPSPSGDTFRYTIADGKLPNIRTYTL